MPFDNASASVLLAQTSAAIVAMLEVAKEFEALLTNSASQNDNSANLARGPYLLGEYAIERDAAYTLFKNQVLVQTKFSYSKCISMGMKVFFW